MGTHSKTPTLAVIDPRGLEIRAVGYWRANETGPVESRITRTARDPAGRAVQQWDPRLWRLHVSDPRTPASLTTVYALSEQILRSDSTDAGMHIELLGPGNQALFGWDSRGTGTEAEFDGLLRPKAKFEAGVGEPRRCVERFLYGEPEEADAQRNQLGQLIRHDDPAGSVLFEQFALTGQCRENTRHYTADASSPDWPLPIEERAQLLEPGAGATTQWRYAPLGPLLEQIDAKGHRLTFARTLDGFLRSTALQLQHQPSAKALVEGIRYNADGNVECELAGNGVRSTLFYSDQDGRLLERRAVGANGGVVQHLLYEHDPMGNILSVEDRALPVRHFANQRVDPISRFHYDSLYQLSAASGWEASAVTGAPNAVKQTDPAAVSNYRQTYRYDVAGNLLQLSHAGAQNPGHQVGAARFSNRCLSWRNGVPPNETEIADAFDGRGNLLMLQPGRHLQWNLRNQLGRVTPIAREGGLDDRESYVYDGAGMRARKISEWQTGSRTLIAEHRYLPSLELRTHSGRGEQLQVISVSTGLNRVRVLHWDSEPPSGSNDRYSYGCTDHAGSIGLELACDGQIIGHQTYYPFGAIAWQSGDNGYGNLGYSGKELDATGLHYFGFRYYAAGLQRWINPDPGEQIDGLNRYRAMRNNPVFYHDKDGRVPYPNDQGGSGARLPETSRRLPQLSTQDKENIAQGAQVAGKLLSYAKHPLISAAGSVLEAGGRMLEVHTAQSQMQVRQRSQLNPLLTPMPTPGNTLGFTGKRAGADRLTDFAEPLSEGIERPNKAPSPLAMQLLAAGFGSGMSEATSMGVMAEDPKLTHHQRNKRGTPAVVN
jgi:insecticidal toxin complex protein TccC